MDDEDPSDDVRISTKLNIRCQGQVQEYDRSHSYVCVSSIRAKGSNNNIVSFILINIISVLLIDTGTT